MAFRDNGDGTWTAAFPDSAGQITFDPSVIAEIRLMDGLGDPGATLQYNSGTDSYDVVSGDGDLMLF